MKRKSEDEGNAPDLQRTAYDTDDPLELMLEESCRIVCKSLPGLALELVVHFVPIASRARG